MSANVAMVAQVLVKVTIFMLQNNKVTTRQHMK
jgi:hypothetical protein